MLKILGKVGKGFATVLGIGIVGGGIVSGPGEVAQAVQAIVEHAPAIIAAAGTLLAAFGIGRKAGHAANE